MQRALWWVIWPGFLAACVAEFVFFAVFDPLDFNMRLQLSREAVYTCGFVAFWLLGILSSGVTLLLLQSPAPGGAALARGLAGNGGNHDDNHNHGREPWNS